MAACSTCGIKIGWTMQRCEDCAKVERAAEVSQLTELLSNELPTLLTVLNRVGLSAGDIHANAFEVLPRDTSYLAVYSSTVFLTERGIITFNFTITTGRLKATETIPVATITSLELKPPSSTLALYSLKLIRAGNEDLEFSAFSAEAVQDFMANTQNAMAAGGKSAPATARTGPSERMKSLSDLRDQGLISESEYEEKRAAILSDL